MKRFALFAILFTTPALATINLEVPIEMAAGYGFQSQAAGAVAFTMTSTELNTNDYDGAAYWFELVCWNNVGSAQDILLIDAASSTIDTLSFPQTGANAFQRARNGSAFTPNSGSDVYRVQLPQTAGGDNLIRCQSARIIVVQTNATKTRIQVPLTARHDGTQNSDTLLDQTTSTSYTQTDPSYFPMWQKTAADWATVTGAAIEITGWHQGGSQTLTATIYDITGTAEVTGAQATITSTTHSHSTADFSWSNMTTAREFDCRYKSSTGVTNARLTKCVMYIELSPVTSVEVYWMLHQGHDAISSAYEHNHQLALINTSAYDSPVVYQEATIAETSSGTVSVQISDCVTDDSNPSSCTPVSGADLSTASATNDLVRSSSLTITDDDRFISEVNWTSGTIEVISNHLVIQATGTASIPLVLF